MPYIIQYGAATTLLGAAAAAGRAEARQRREEREQHVSLAVEAAARQKDVVQLRAKAQGLQSAAALRREQVSERFREEELGLRKRGMALTEKREARVTAAATEKQALITQGTALAISELDRELAEGLIDPQAHAVRKTAVYTGNQALYTSSLRRYPVRKRTDEKHRAEVMENVEKHRRALNSPGASPTQIQEAATKYEQAVGEGTRLWGEGFQELPWEYTSGPDFTKIKTPVAASIAAATRAGQMVKTLPMDRRDLEQGVAYPLPTKGGALHTWTGSRFKLYGEPKPKKKVSRYGG